MRVRQEVLMPRFCLPQSMAALLAIMFTMGIAVQNLSAERINPRWKILVLIYENVEVQYTDSSGVFHDITTQMTPAEIQIASQAATRFYENDVPQLTSG